MKPARTEIIKPRFRFGQKVFNAASHKNNTNGQTDTHAGTQRDGQSRTANNWRITLTSHCRMQSIANRSLPWRSWNFTISRASCVQKTPKYIKP